MSTISSQLHTLYSDLDNLMQRRASSLDTCDYAQAKNNEKVYEELQGKIGEHIGEWAIGLDDIDLNCIMFIRACFTVAKNNTNHPDYFNEYIAKIRYFIDLLEDYSNNRED